MPPRRMKNGSLRWPTKKRPWRLQSGRLISDEAASIGLVVRERLLSGVVERLAELDLVRVDERHALAASVGAVAEDGVDA